MLATVDEVVNSSGTYDYVICGGGTAGLTVAARLTEDPSVSVLVLEAGGANIDDWTILRSASWGSHFGNPNQSWAYRTVNQKHAANQELTWVRGKGLGGSTQINFMSWTKPPASEIDDFERLGNPGWNWKNHQKYVARTEGFVTPSAEVQERNHLLIDSLEIGTDGPLKVAYPGTIDEGELRVRETLINAGFPIAPLPLNGDPKGTFFAPSIYDPATHTRSYATTAFYLPNKDRKNFVVLVDAFVNRVVTEDAEGGAITAKGVEFEHEGATYTVNARKEVILCTGALKSPHILELSGIGRKDVLERIGVPMKVELPGVGENLQDHFSVSMSYELREEVDWETVDLLRDPVLEAKHRELHAQGKGIYTKAPVNLSFLPLDLITDKADAFYETIKKKITENAHRYPPGLMEQYEIQLERMRQGAPGCELICLPVFISVPNPPAPGKRYVTLFPSLNHTFSRGWMHSKSSNPRDDPEIDPCFFEQEIDLDIQVELVKFARGLAKVSPLKEMLVSEVNPGPEIQTDDQVRDYVKQFFFSTWHTTATCSMLPKEKNGVVDPNLKVYGTTNLRVVDFSIAPLIFAAHPTATVFAIAEQAADIIKGKFSA
ncbi:uncharacterized protein FIBRA_07460 [Fibroporia radiculosa]|uniref:Glucose-methanol-choline oxidoreductase N-terminal domain-containing protein n=1 Tax=Fibroporia radiculosa TaxID=599839 RepID=J4GV10_9APHY|nr:uncharacterized protein FIBRA_07460 [Fibroporia radiculosa]CCM05250.1 predicted protein [Fibroporia radiculosa]